MRADQERKVIATSSHAKRARDRAGTRRVARPDFAIDLDAERSDRALGYATRPVGTAVYMAPEQAASLRFGTASDWYSMGVVLYEALTGQRPYSGTDLEVLLEKQETRPVAPGELVAGLPPDLERLCVDLLSPDPAERPSGPEVLRRLGVHEDVRPRAGRPRRGWLHAAFVGRTASLARIQQAFDRSRSAAVVVACGRRGRGGQDEPRRRRASQFMQRAPDGWSWRARARAIPQAHARARPHCTPDRALDGAQLVGAHPTGRERFTSGVRRSAAFPYASVSAARALRLGAAFPGAGVGREAKTRSHRATPEPLSNAAPSVHYARCYGAGHAASGRVWCELQWADVDHDASGQLAGRRARCARMLLC